MAGRGAVLTLRVVAVAAGLTVCAGVTAIASTTASVTDHRRLSAGGDGTRNAEVIAATTAAAGGLSVVDGVPGDVAPMNRVDCRKHKCIALTFDDGPAATTARLLDTLAANGAKATFFLVGRNVESHPQIARRELAEGHELGNHSYTHANLRRSSRTKVTWELRRTQNAIHRAAGVSPKLMRPPYGETGAQVAAITRRMRMAQILWSLDPLDWRVRNSGKVERKVVSGARRGSIVLMHDIHPTTVAAIPGIIRRLAAKGYSFVTVSELFGTPLVPGKVYVGR